MNSEDDFLCDDLRDAVSMLFALTVFGSMMALAAPLAGIAWGIHHFWPEPRKKEEGADDQSG